SLHLITGRQSATEHGPEKSVLSGSPSNYFDGLPVDQGGDDLCSRGNRVVAGNTWILVSPHGDRSHGVARVDFICLTNQADAADRVIAGHKKVVAEVERVRCGTRVLREAQLRRCRKESQEKKKEY